MAAPGPSDDEEPDPRFVYCASCGAKVPTSWSFCRSCESSLEDARPTSSGLEQLRADDTYEMEDAGCPKCGHEDAEIDEIATTGKGLTRLFDVQNRRFSAVSCTNCGYTEFYRGDDASIIIDLFLGG